MTRFVASGATGEVWQAVDAGTDRPVAVKILHPYLADDRLTDRLRQARRSLTGLWHPGIARVIDVVVADGVVALVTDFVPGTDLARLLASNGPLAPATAARVGAEMADALAAAHDADMVHGDLKPANVIVPAQNGADPEPVRLTDFSLATLVHLGRTADGPNGVPPPRQPGAQHRRYQPPGSSQHPDHTDWQPPPHHRAGAHAAPEYDRPGAHAAPQHASPQHASPQHASPQYRSGSPASPYTAPWVIDGAVPTPASDVHALGIVLFEMVTGAPTRDHVDQPDRVDRRLLDVIDRCVLGDQTARPSAEAVAQRLHELVPQLSRLPPRTTALRPRTPRSRPPASPRSRGERPRSRPRLLLAGVAATVLLVAAIVVAVRMLTSSGSTDAPPQGNTNPAASTAQAPTTPPEATTPTQEGGGEFVRYWFATFTYAVRTGDTATLAAATSPDCRECQAAIETVETGYLAGGSMRGGDYLVRRITTSSLYSAERPVYDAIVDRSPRTTVDTGGTVQATLPPLTFANCVVVLEWTNSQWQVREVVTPGCVA